MGGQAIEGVKRLTAFLVPAERFLIIGRDTKHKSVAEHHLFDARVVDLPIIEEWVRDMVTNGWAGGVAMVEVDGEDVMPIDGKQRIIHAREANKRLDKAGRPLIEVPTMIKKGEDADKYGSMIALNEFRRDDSILEKARKAQAFLNFGKSHKEAASRFGVTESAVKQWLQLLDADPKIIKAVESEKVSGSVALELAKLPRDQQVPKFDELKEQGKLNVEGAKQAVYVAKGNGDGKKNGRAAAAKDDGDDENGHGKKLPVNAIRKICAAYKADELAGKAKNIAPETIKVLQVVAGLTEPRGVAGLTAALAQVGYGPPEESE